MPLLASYLMASASALAAFLICSAVPLYYKIIYYAFPSASLMIASLPAYALMIDVYLSVETFLIETLFSSSVLLLRARASLRRASASTFYTFNI